MSPTCHEIASREACVGVRCYRRVAASRSDRRASPRLRFLSPAELGFEGANQQGLECDLVGCCANTLEQGARKAHRGLCHWFGVYQPLARWHGPSCVLEVGKWLTLAPYSESDGQCCARDVHLVKTELLR